MRGFSPRRASLILQIAGWPLLGLAIVARFGQHRQARFLEFVDTFQLHLLGPWAGLGLLGGALRSPGLGLLGLAGGALALSQLAIARGRAGGRTDPTRPDLRLLTANVLARNPSAAGLAALIEREQPDLVALQELRTPYWAELRERIGRDFPHVSIRTHERFNGAGLLSRWPIRRVETFQLAGRGHLCQWAELEVDGRRVHFFNIHLQTNFEVARRVGAFPPFWLRYRMASARDAQVDDLLERLAPVEGPVVVAGDFNTSAGSRPHRQLLGALRDAFREAGRGLGHTFPQGRPVPGLLVPIPLIRIDYAFFKGPLRPVRAQTQPQPGSDHLALVADFAFETTMVDGCGRLTTEPAGAGA